MGEIRVLINDVVKRFLLSADRASRNQIRKAFEYLESGLWEGGLRIKKLHGVARTILEARINRGDRILLTLGRKSHAGEDRLIYVWGIVPHDSVENAARAIIPENAPFLRFSSQDIDQQDVDLEKLDASCFTQELPEERSFSESGNQRWFALDEFEWERLLLYSKDEFEIFLYLTSEQRQLLESNPPLLVSGTAGSGKTTLSVYYLFRPSLVSGRKLFLTYNDHLRNFCRRLYEGLLNQRSGQDRIGSVEFLTFRELCLAIVPEAQRRFPQGSDVGCARFLRMFAMHKLADKYDGALIWEEIRSIIKGAKPQISAKNLRKILRSWKDLQDDSAMVRQLQDELLGIRLFSLRDKGEAVLNRLVGCSLLECAREVVSILAKKNESLFRALDTIASQMEKHEADYSSALMTLAEYEQLGRKRAPAFAHNRSDIYSIAEWYQSKLESERLWDEIDLTRAAIQTLDSGKARLPRYDFVSCDEVQDFTDIQHSLIIRLPRHPEAILLAGDPKQIINPSGFRWEEVKRLFYDRGFRVPDVHFLSLNFRCVGSIVTLSNALLMLKQDLLGVHSDERLDDWKFQGRPPFLIENIPEQMLIESLRETGADRTILTRTERERDSLKRILGTELVFTIEEAKGLEFRSVLLWKFCTETEALWKRMLKSDTIKIHDSVIRHEINLLYVGVTRAQQNLIVYDGLKAASIWIDERLEDLLFRTESSAFLDEIWRSVSTPEEWKAQADTFFETGHYKAAAECYKNAGLPDFVDRALAHACEKRGEYLKAAHHWEQIGEWECAAEDRERGEDFEEAARIWEQLGRNDRAIRCNLPVMEKQKRYGDAAELCEVLMEWERAIENWKRANRPDRLAPLYERNGDSPQAARCYLACGQWEKAAGHFLKAERLPEAAQCLESAEKYVDAAKIWESLESDEDQLRCLKLQGDPLALAVFYESHKLWKAAIEEYRKIGDPVFSRLESELNLLRPEPRQQRRRALRLQILGKHEEAAILWEKCKEFELAGECYRAIGSLYNAGRCFAKGKLFAEAASMYGRSQEDREQKYKALQRVVGQAVRFGKNKAELEKVAEEFVVEGNHYGAFLIYLGVSNRLKTAECALKLEFPMLALAQLERVPDWSKVLELLVTNGLFESGVEMLVDGREKETYTEKSSHLTALLTAWWKSNPQGEEHSRLIEKVSALSFRLPLDLVLSVLEPEGKYDEIHFCIQNKLAPLSQKGVQDLLRPFVEEAAQLEQAGRMEQAGFRYLVIGWKTEAARCLRNVPVRNETSYMMEAAGLTPKVLDWLEQNKLYFRASHLALNSGNYARAAENFRKDESEKEGARCLEKKKQYELAVELYKESGNLHKAATLLEKLKHFDQAAELWHRLGLKQRQLACLKKRKSKTT